MLCCRQEMLPSVERYPVPFNLWMLWTFLNVKCPNCVWGPWLQTAWFPRVGLWLPFASCTVHALSFVLQAFFLWQTREDTKIIYQWFTAVFETVSNKTQIPPFVKILNPHVKNTSCHFLFFFFSFERWIGKKSSRAFVTGVVLSHFSSRLNTRCFLKADLALQICSCEFGLSDWPSSIRSDGSAKLHSHFSPTACSCEVVGSGE